VRLQERQQQQHAADIEKNASVLVFHDIHRSTRVTVVVSVVVYVLISILVVCVGAGRLRRRCKAVMGLLLLTGFSATTLAVAMSLTRLAAYSYQFVECQRDLLFFASWMLVSCLYWTEAVSVVLPSVLVRQKIPVLRGLIDVCVTLCLIWWPCVFVYCEGLRFRRWKIEF
jgi:hypothetical protein